MHGSPAEKSIRRRHMWPVPHSSATTVASDLSTASDSFSKDGRKICVGDCALFKPPQDSPPFIGIIRRLILDKEERLCLGVNWLYRPADVKLSKGVSLEATPNEVFYSFHKDEIPAASLLHPCKVAFLRKGVELPSGISSFVCRRVYDTENNCLWWLTDKDFINERQEEVDQLLDKTRLEMHGAVQSGGRSPKPLNTPSSTPQIKSGSDSLQNSTSPFSSQVKGKKRERGDQGSEPAKRERLVKIEDGESGQSRPENMLKSELGKITDKGGLLDTQGVEKFVQLMKAESADKKIDLAGRRMLVDVIAVTDRLDCLGQFVQRKGLCVLDEWLQEVHKGKLGDGSSPKESDKSVEEFLFALLCALEKVPVNLHALQTCNVGKSVNNLRSYRNSEIQKKARSLVDMWKKRVEAEMNLSETKTGSSRGGVSWPTKHASSEVSHVGSRKIGSSSEVGTKSSTMQPSVSKTPQIKLGCGETVSKSSGSPGSTKLLSISSGNLSKDQNFRTLGAGTSDLPLTPIKEERSSSSSQSQNNSQSSDHARTVGSLYREDARSSSAGSVSVSKISGTDALRTISSSATIRRRLPLVGAFCVFTLGISNLLPTLSFSAFRTGTAQSLPFAPLLRSKFGSQSEGVGSVRMEGSSDTTVPSIVVYVTVPSREVGKKLAESLVREKLAACVNLVPGIESIYEWKGEVQTDSEELLIIKTRQSLFEALTAHVKANHPYDVPEVIALPINAGSLPYLEWIKNSTRD